MGYARTQSSHEAQPRTHAGQPRARGRAHGIGRGAHDRRALVARARHRTRRSCDGMTTLATAWRAQCAQRAACAACAARGVRRVRSVRSVRRVRRAQRGQRDGRVRV
eukprot:2021135-Prymnesium_polylepis.1